MKYNWTGDLDSRCECELGNLTLKAEDISNGKGQPRWWWCVYEDGIEVASVYNTMKILSISKDARAAAQRATNSFIKTRESRKESVVF